MQEKKKLLILSGDKDNRYYIKQVLQKDYDLTVLDNGRTAIDNIRQGKRYDGIISDVYLQGMGGLDLADNLRILGYKTPILFTEYLGQKELNEIKNVGAQVINTGYLSPAQLRSTINELVNESPPMVEGNRVARQYTQFSNYS